MVADIIKLWLWDHAIEFARWQQPTGTVGTMVCCARHYLFVDFIPGVQNRGHEKPECGPCDPTKNVLILVHKWLSCIDSLNVLCTDG